MHRHEVSRTEIGRACTTGWEVFCKVSIDDRVREGVVHLPKGAQQPDGTALRPDDISEVGGRSFFNDARVEVERVGSS
jgi:hypothetical protein